MLSNAMLKVLQVATGVLFNRKTSQSTSDQKMFQKTGNVFDGAVNNQ